MQCGKPLVGKVQNREQTPSLTLTKKQPHPHTPGGEAHGAHTPAGKAGERGGRSGGRGENKIEIEPW